MRDKIIVITGASTKKSLAFLIAAQIKRISSSQNPFIINISNSVDEDCTNKVTSPIDENWIIDFTGNEAKTLFVLKEISRAYPKIDILINCSGISENNWFDNVSMEEWKRVMNVNLNSYFMTCQNFLDNLSRTGGTILNMVSNAASIPMRTSTAYNVSKAGALMLSKQLARELTQKFNITVFSISPNKLVGTNMSENVDDSIPILRGWTKIEADDNQTSALITGEQTNPETLAEFIAFILSTKERHFYLSGCDIPYGA